MKEKKENGEVVALEGGTKKERQLKKPKKERKTLSSMAVSPSPSRSPKFSPHLSPSFRPGTSRAPSPRSNSSVTKSPPFSSRSPTVPLKPKSPPPPSVAPFSARSSAQIRPNNSRPSSSARSPSSQALPRQSSLTILSPRSPGRSIPQPAPTNSPPPSTQPRRSSLTILSPRSPPRSPTYSSSNSPPAPRRSSLTILSPRAPSSKIAPRKFSTPPPATARSPSNPSLFSSSNNTQSPATARSPSSINARSPPSPDHFPSSLSPSPNFVTPSLPSSLPRPSSTHPTYSPPPLACAPFPSSFPPPSGSLDSEKSLGGEKKEKKITKASVSKLFSSSPQKREIHSEAELKERKKKYDSVLEMEGEKGFLSREAKARKLLSPSRNLGSNFQRSAPHINTDFSKLTPQSVLKGHRNRSTTLSNSQGGKDGFPGIRQHVVPAPSDPENSPRTSPKENFEPLPLPGPLLSPSTETFLDREERRERQYNEFMNAPEEKEEEEEEEIDEDLGDPLLSLSLDSNHQASPFDISFCAMEQETEANEALIIDNGSFFLRAGINTDNEPSFQVRNMVNFDKYDDEEKILQNFVRAEKSKFFDAKTIARKKVEEYFYSINNDGSVQWDHQEGVWEHMFEKLPKNSSSFPLLLSELPTTTPQERGKKAEYLFEKYDVPSLCLLPDCVLNMYGSGKQTGVVVDIGRSTTRITPVYYGSALRHSQRILRIGSLNLVDYLQSLVCQIDSKAKEVSSLDFDAYLRNHCYLPPYFSEEFKRTENFVHKKRYNLFQFPGLKKEIDMGKIRFSAPEPLFKPSILGVSDFGIPQAIQTVIGSLKMEGMEQGIEQEMLNNIILTGGGSHLFGLPSRLEKSIETLYQNEGSKREVCVTAQEGRDLGTWRGGRVVSHFSNFSSMSIRMEEFQEVGPQIVDWMCPQ